jgi:hypothetical protein
VFAEEPANLASVLPFGGRDEFPGGHGEKILSTRDTSVIFSARELSVQREPAFELLGE